MNSEEGREEMNANAIEELTSGDGWDWMSLVEGRLPAVANIGIHIFVALAAYWIGRRVIKSRGLGDVYKRQF